jgi:hypothetical protein
MKRRTFIKTTGLIAAATALPVVITSKPEIVLKGKQIEDISLGTEPMSVLQAHRRLCEIFEKNAIKSDDFWILQDPTYRIANEYIIVRDEYWFTDKSFELMYGGTVKQNNGVWYGLKMVGPEEYKKRSRIVVDGVKYKKHEFMTQIKGTHVGVTRMDIEYYVNNTLYQQKHYPGLIILPAV